jgi:hypothetical protein
MFRRSPRDDGDELIYLSQTKLVGLAGRRGVKLSYFKTAMDAEASGSVTVPVTPATVSVRGSVRAERVDEQRAQRAIEKQLRNVLRAMAGDTLPDLDAPEPRLSEGHWFRFHRVLRFGIGSADHDQSLAALIMIDRDPIGLDGAVPGLLLHGAPIHLMAPYRPKQLGDPSEGRSGSGTGPLFAWLRTADALLDEDPDRSLDALETEDLERDPDPPQALAQDIYRMFTEGQGLLRLRELQNQAPCEGVARITHISASDQGTIVMASPLYVRQRALTPQPRG